MPNLGDIKFTPEQFKRFFEENPIYMRFDHHCGFKGNGYHKAEDGMWKLRDFCPQCNEKLEKITLEQWLARLFEKEKTFEGGYKMPKFTFNEQNNP